MSNAGLDNWKRPSFTTQGSCDGCGMDFVLTGSTVLLGFSIKCGCSIETRFRKVEPEPGRVGYEAVKA